MNKKKYIMPKAKFVELKGQVYLLAGSPDASGNTEGSGADWGDGEDDI